MRVLHVIERLGGGGAARALLASARATAQAARLEHAVLSLHPPDPAARALARAAGVRLVDASEPAARHAAVVAADITQVHFWNTPELYAWLRGDLPPMRLLLTLHVAGAHPAQVVTPRLLDFADFVAPTSPCSLELPAFRALSAARRAAKVAVVLATEDLASFAAVTPRPHTGCHAGYVGTVSPVKMHPRFVEMSARVHTPALRFLVYGIGDGVATVLRRARALGVADRFEWRGYATDVAAALADFDIFGYPLRPDTYAAAELVLQEAMSAGVPPVVFAHGGIGSLVDDGVTGRVVATEEEYAAAIDALASDPAERARLGRNARAHASAYFGVERVAPRQLAVYEEMMRHDKRARRWPHDAVSPHAGANAFLDSLGDAAGCFRVSLLSADATAVRAAEQTIARASPVLTDPTAGGVLHYRIAYPDDPYLRLWSGLILAAQGRPALAAAELQHAQSQGLADARVTEYLKQVIAAAREPKQDDKAGG